MSTKQQPIRWIRDNIFINDKGIPYAIWMLPGLSYGISPLEEKQKTRAIHQDLFQSLVGEYKLYGLVTTISPEVIINKMLKDVEQPSQQWLNECRLNHQAWEEEPAGDRLFFLVAPLRTFDPVELFHRVSTSLDMKLRDSLGSIQYPPSEAAFIRWRRWAETIEKKIPDALAPARVGAHMLRWISDHLMTRGAVASASIPQTREQQLAEKIEDWKKRSEADEAAGAEPEPKPELASDTHWVNARSLLGEPYIDEGDLDGLSEEKLTHLKLLRRRYVRVESGEGPPSYQSFAAIGLAPQGGFTFPGSEFINAASSLPLDLDFCLIITSTKADRVKRKNARAERNIRDQVAHRAGTEAQIGGASTEIDKNAAELQAYMQSLDASDQEVEVAATMIFSAAGDNAEFTDEQMRQFRNTYRSDEWITDIPLGGQEDFFWDFWPGSTPSATSKDYTQITTGREFSMGVPISTDDLGADHGFPLGRNITTGRRGPVMTALGTLAEGDSAGHVACLGDTGAGKTVAQKVIASHSIDRGAKFLGVDHSASKEWEALMRTLTKPNVIEFKNPQFSIDPIRLYGPGSTGQRATSQLLTMLFGVKLQSQEGLFITDLLRRWSSGDEDAQFSSLSDLHHKLEKRMVGEERDEEVIESLVRKLHLFSNLDMARTYFDPALEVMDFSAQATIFCTRGMELPTWDEMTNQALRDELTLEKIIGAASYAYLAAICSNVMEEDPSQEVIFNVDETHHMTSSPQGVKTIELAIKEGRRNKAAVVLGTHSAEELGPERVRALIPQRMVFRTKDKDLARTNLRYLDESYVTPEFVERVKGFSPQDHNMRPIPGREGECLYRDPRGRVGVMQVMLPRDPQRAKATLSTPPRSKAGRLEGES